MNWRYAENRNRLKNVSTPKGMGHIYAVKLQVMPNFYLVKIGATEMPRIRFENYLTSNSKIYCLSPAHYNCFENEQILQEHFKQYRVPAKPTTRGGNKVELFNISLTYMFQNMPTLKYETDLENCKIVQFDTQTMYYSKK